MPPYRNQPILPPPSAGDHTSTTRCSARPHCAEAGAPRVRLLRRATFPSSRRATPCRHAARQSWRVVNGEWTPVRPESGKPSRDFALRVRRKAIAYLRDEEQGHTSVVPDEPLIGRRIGHPRAAADRVAPMAPRRGPARLLTRFRAYSATQRYERGRCGCRSPTGAHR